MKDVDAERLLVIVGSGGHGRVVCDIARAIGRTKLLFCDPARAADKKLDDVPISSLDEVALLEEFGGRAEFIVAIGSRTVRRNALSRLEEAGASIACLLHPRASVSERTVIAPGTVAMAGAIINVGATIGAGTIINTGAIVDHDCVIGRWCHVAPGAVLGGTVTVGDLTDIGAGAVVLLNRKVGAGATVGAGAVVNRDVADGVTVVGSPARPMSVLEKRTVT